MTLSDKKKQIMEAALRCFSRKGFEATSIQEIVDEIGMAKGSIYFYFKSKEELLLSVIAYFSERMMAGMTVLPEERQLPPREKFRMQLRRHFAYVTDNREFPIMLMREPPAIESRRTQLRGIMAGIRRRYLQWIKQHIDDIYGDEASPYAGDGAALMGGMMMEYVRLALIGRPSLDVSRLADFLVDRLDDVVMGMVQAQASPILRRDFDEADGSASSAASYVDRIRAIAKELRETAEREVLPDADEDRRTSLLAALALFEEQIAKPVPDRILVRGMLAYLRELALPSWRPFVDRLTAIMNHK